MARKRPSAPEARKSQEVVPAEESAPAGPPVAQGFLRPDGALVITARELLTAHTPEPGFDICPRCGMKDPCPTARHASVVCITARDQQPASA
jgi:hypothetical protein